MIGRDGKPMTDSVQILKDIRSKNAALAPLGGIGETLGGYKGYGYATVVEILCAALQNGIFLKELEGKDENGNIRPYHLGHFFIVINPEFFMGEKSFRETAGAILRSLRSSKKAPGADRIYTAGEKEYLSRKVRETAGLEAGPALQKDMIAIRDSYHLPYSFTFEE